MILARRLASFQSVKEIVRRFQKCTADDHLLALILEVDPWMAARFILRGLREVGIKKP